MTGYRISPRLPVLFSPLLVCPYLTLTCISGALFLFYAPKILKPQKIILSFPSYCCFNAKIPHRSAGFLPASFLSMQVGTAEGIRTPDLLVRSQTLYPAELQPHIAPLSLFIIPHSSGKCKRFFQIFLLFLFFAVCLQKSVGSAGNLCYNRF